MATCNAADGATGNATVNECGPPPITIRERAGIAGALFGSSQNRVLGLRIA